MKGVWELLICPLGRHLLRGRRQSLQTADKISRVGDVRRRRGAPFQHTFASTAAAWKSSRNFIEAVRPVRPERLTQVIFSPDEHSIRSRVTDRNSSGPSSSSCLHFVNQSRLTVAVRAGCGWGRHFGWPGRNDDSQELARRIRPPKKLCPHVDTGRSRTTTGCSAGSHRVLAPPNVLKPGKMPIVQL
jgi:hypothetical protein